MDGLRAVQRHTPRRKIPVELAHSPCAKAPREVGGRCDGAVLDRYLTRTDEGGLQVRYDGIAIRVPLCADAPRAAGGGA